MPANLLIRVVLPFTTNLPRDVAVNDWAVFVEDTAPAADVAAAILSFYNDEIAGGDSVGHNISGLVTRATNGCRIEGYVVDLTSGDTGSPVEVVPFTLAAATTSTALPPEVALCTSFAATVPPGGRAGRYRGRVYIGPLAGNVIGTTTSKPTPTFVTTLKTATDRLHADLTDLGCDLSIWSRTDHQFYPAVRGWVDDAFDTQRRRGIAASSRAVWPA